MKFLRLWPKDPHRLKRVLGSESPPEGCRPEVLWWKMLVREGWSREAEH